MWLNKQWVFLNSIDTVSPFCPWKLHSFSWGALYCTLKFCEIKRQIKAEVYVIFWAFHIFVYIFKVVVRLLILFLCFISVYENKYVSTSFIKKVEHWECPQPARGNKLCGMNACDGYNPLYIISMYLSPTELNWNEYIFAGP